MDNAPTFFIVQTCRKCSTKYRFEATARPGDVSVEFWPCMICGSGIMIPTGLISAEIVENVYLWCGIVIEIVADSGGKLGNTATSRSRPAVGRAADVKARRNYSHVYHWADPDLLVTPAIGIHRSEGAKPQIRSGAQVCHKGFATKCKTTTECSLSVPGCLTVTSLELVLSARSSVSEPQLKTKFVSKVEIV